MRVKTAPRLRSQPAQLSCHVPAPVFSQATIENTVQSSLNRNCHIKYSQGMGSRQQGASTWLLALFVVVVLVTAIVAILLGYKLGYQSGYYSLKNETEQATINNEQATNELKDLRVSHKILTNQVETAKQELTISLANLDEVRQKQKALKVDNRQVTQAE